MPIYIFLGKYREQAIKDIKKEQENKEQAVKMAEKMGIKIIGLYNVMGEYDIINIFDCPSDEVAASIPFVATTVECHVLKAFTSEEFDKIVNKLP